MSALVLSHSAYGNTEQIARSIGDALVGNVDVIHIGNLDPSAVQLADDLFAGSPTQSGKATPALGAFLAKVPEAVLKRGRIFAFDTRLSSSLVGIFGFGEGHSLSDEGFDGGEFPKGLFSILRCQVRGPAGNSRDPWQVGKPGPGALQVCLSCGATAG